MGRSARYIPKHLGKKLLSIRVQLGIETYEEMVVRLAVKEVKLFPASILRYETGKLDPPSIVLLRYARLAKVPMEDLVDDLRTLPKIASTRK